MKKDRSDALITYAWCRSSYVALRSLNQLGLTVTLSDSHLIGMGQQSRYNKIFYRYKSPLSQPRDFIIDINNILHITRARFLLPVHDETVILAQNRDLLPRDIILPIHSYEKLEFANDKNKMADFAENLGLPVPRKIHWHTIEDLELKLLNENGPWVVKLRKGNSAKGVFYPHSNAELIELVQQLITEYQLSSDRYPIIQERVEGEGWGVSCLYWEGQRLASFSHKRLREKTSTGGTSTLRMSARNPLLEEIAHKILDSMNWHGLAMVEFKYNSETGQGWFIEINPRLWGSIHLAVASGVDFPALLFIAATKGPKRVIDNLQPYKEGLVARWYLGDSIVGANQLRHGKVLSALKMLLPGGADTYDDWFWDDLGASFGQAAYYFYNFLKYRSLNPEQDGMLG